MRLPGVLSSWLLILTACSPLFAQAVISTHSGLINYHEGSVLIDDQPLEQKIGTFSSLKEGSTLRTEKGRVEILLTPGVFLRIDENSALHMLANSLTNPRVELLSGAAILDSNDAPSGSNSLVLVYKTYQLRFPKPGVYRLDSEPGVFETYTGEAEIRASGKPAQIIDESHQFFFGIDTVTNKYGDGAIDNFSEWARNRAELIAADNRAAAQSTAPLPDPSTDPNDYSLGAGVPVPSYGLPGSGYGFPSSGPFGGTVLLGSGFYGSYGPFAGPWFPDPLLVVYVFPRHYGGYPKNGTYPSKPGFPILPPTHAGYPHSGYPHSGYPHAGYPYPAPYRPTPTPLHSTLTMPGVNHSMVAPPVRAVATPHYASPAPAHSVGLGAIHHR
ncbi:MAG: hypothetical protein JO210_02750 [Acidobacteriaceae bacterium]|nr:hypothetical protein [Acidobacteriaceae bacterium]